MSIALNLVFGLLFGVGLIVSGMTNPEKILNFLDITGTWDPSLAFVMAGAIAVTAPGYWLVRRRAAPLLEPVFTDPPPAPIDVRLITGAAIFGVGWGLGGLCPGPAITSLPLATPGIMVFVPALLAGVIAGSITSARSFRRTDG
jgi:uncharacterized membrane protein YedE/YeeE